MRILMLTLLVGLSQPATADEAVPPLTKEQRAARAEKHERVAEMHEKMAECLRSDKDLSECHEQMRKDCPMAGEGGLCPMMGEMGPGKMGGRKGTGRPATDGKKKAK